jgi:vitamin B12 transporter
VYDLVKLVPGVTVTRNGGPGSTSSVRIRGSNPGQVRVMIDGVNMNDASSASAEFDFNSLLTENIERIEVLRGPQSALYGSDAMGGVINIITKKGEGPAQFSALAEVGSYATFRQAAGVQGSQEEIDYSLQLQNYKTGGLSRVANTTEDDGSTDKTITSRLGWHVNENMRFDISGNYSDLSAEYDRFNADGDNEQDKKTLSGRFAATIQTFKKKWEHIVSLQGASTKRDFDEPLSTSTRFSTFDGTQTTAEYQSNFKLRARDVFTAGILTEKQEAKNTATTNLGVFSTNVNNDFRINSLYGQYLLGLGETTTLTLGGRRDDHSAFGSYNTARTTIAQEIPDTGTIVRASYGTGFKSPSLFQLFHPSFGTPTLQPEESTGYDVGVEQNLLNRRLNLSVTAFNNDYKNLIEFNSGTSKFRNVRSVNTQGTESTASFAITPEFSISSSHTFLLTEDETTGRTLPRRPKHHFVTGFDYTVLGKGNIGMDVRYVSRQWDSATTSNRVKPFTTVDLRASYDVTPQVALYTRLENLFDKEYQEIRNFNAPGFSAYVGVKVHY